MRTVETAAGRILVRESLSLNTPMGLYYAPITMVEGLYLVINNQMNAVEPFPSRMFALPFVATVFHSGAPRRPAI